MSASEIALFSLSSYTVRAFREDRNPQKKLVALLLERPKDLLVTILIVHIASSILIQNIVSSICGPSSGWFVNVGLPLLLIIFIAEIIPKSIALPNNTFIALRVAKSIAFLERMLGPVRFFLIWVTNHISRFLFIFLKNEKPLSQEELEFVLERSRREGVLHEEESEIIARYLDLKNKVAKEMMRKQEECCFIDITQSLSAIPALFSEKRAPFLLVCENDPQNLLGILTFQRFFLHEGSFRAPVDVRKQLTKPFYVPESMNGWFLFHELRKKKEECAVVVDEYGSISGCVLGEDLVATVLAEEVDEKNYTKLSEDVVIAKGRMELQEFAEIFGVWLPSKSNAITLGGWLTEQLEDIPLSGMKYVTDDFLFYVLESKATHVQRIYVRRLHPVKRRDR